MTDSLLTQVISAMGNSANPAQLTELPESAPFTAEQRQWLNGLLTGISTIVGAAARANGGGQPAAPGTPLAIYYGSQSGNSEVLARNLKKYAATQGFEAKTAELDSITPAALSEHQHALIVCSTFGEGEPPDNAKQFYSALMSAEAPPLPASLNFSVCGLGDSSYAQYNKCARDIEARLSELGAVACRPMAVCDVDFEDDFEQWKGGVFASEVFKAAAGAAATGPAEVEPAGPAFTKATPFLANLIGATTLSASGSAKRVNHVEISLAGGGADMHYEVGDALGVWANNCAEDVEAVLKAGGFNGREVVQMKSGPGTLRVLLLTKLDISTVNAKAAETWGLDDLPEGHQVYDVLTQLNPDLDAQTFVNGLRPLQPRLYSIASSPAAHPEKSI